MAITGFVLALIGLLICWFPFAGFLATIGMIVALVSMRRRQPRRGLALAGVVVGAVATLITVIWSLVFVYLASKSSCPHVYSFDGQRYALDADPLSGSLFAGAESTDWDRLEHLAWHQGGYKIRIVNERDELDFVNSVYLLRVAHGAGQQVLPTKRGELRLLEEEIQPVACTDARGRDQLDKLRSADDLAFESRLEDFPPGAVEEPREALELTFERTSRAQDTLILRLRNTDFGSQILAEYLAEFGPGLGTLLDWAQSDSSYPYRQRLDDEMHRMAIPLVVETWDGSRWQVAGEIGPIGPAVYRSLAFDLGASVAPGPTQRVRLEMSPLYWQIDSAGLARSAPVSAERIEPQRALDDTGRDRTAELLRDDDRRTALERGQSIDLTFSAAAVEGPQTVLVQISGYYDVQIGGRAFLNPLAIWRHKSSTYSMPRYVLDKAREARAARPDARVLARGP